MPTGVGDIASGLLESIQANWKQVYLKAVDATPDSNPLSAQMKRTRKFKAAPDGFTFMPKLETGGKVANISGPQLLPKASGPKRKQGKIGAAHTYTVVAIDGKQIPLTKDTKNAFVSELENQMDDGMQRVRTDVERQNNGDGRGILCVLLTVVGAPTYGAENPYGRANAGPGTMLLIEGAEIACIDPANGAERSRGTIETVNPTTEEFDTVDELTDAEIGDYIVRCNDVDATGADAVTNYLGEVAGIQAVTKSGDEFEGIDGAVFGRWNGISQDNGGTSRPITRRLLNTFVATVKTKSGGRKPTLHYTTEGISIDLVDQLAALQRFPTLAKLKGDYEGIQMGDKTVLTGDLCPKGCWFALNLEEECVGTMDLAAMGYVDLDGAELHRMEGRHVYRADLWMPHGIIWFLRNAHGVLADLQDDSSIVR